MLSIEQIQERLAQLRAKIHSCNRNPVPSRARVEWRAELDRILADIAEPEQSVERN